MHELCNDQHKINRQEISFKLLQRISFVSLHIKNFKE